MRDTEERIRLIRELSKREADELLNDVREKLYPGTNRKWGGLFLIQLDRPGKHFRKYDWMAIDDSEGKFEIRTFKKRQKAINWLSESRGPKLCRI